MSVSENPPKSIAKPDPSVVTDLAVAYRTSMALFVANDLNVFTALADRPGTAEELAERCSGQPRPMAMLLNACAALGLLEKNERLYCNTPVADAFLVQGKPGYIGDGLKYSRDLYPAWGKLDQLVRTNRPVIEPDSILGGDREKTRNFVLGMHNRALGVAAALPDAVDLTGRKQLLDVGGGPGTYSILLVQATPGLQAIVLDLPDVLEITKEILDSYQCRDRIRVMAGDYTTVAFESGNDVVLLSGMMHREESETCRLLLRKAFASLISGGCVIVSDVFFEDESRCSPLFATHFALNMMLTSQDGSAHAHSEIMSWMTEAGFRKMRVERLPPPNPHSLVLGSKA